MDIKLQVRVLEVGSATDLLSGGLVTVLKRGPLRGTPLATIINPQ